MIRLSFALLSVLTIAACGGDEAQVQVQYGLACAATCTGGELLALEIAACDVPGQDLTMIAQQSVDRCVASAEAEGCPAASCACQASETTIMCE